MKPNGVTVALALMLVAAVFFLGMKGAAIFVVLFLLIPPTRRFILRGIPPRESRCRHEFYFLGVTAHGRMVTQCSKCGMRVKR